MDARLWTIAAPKLQARVAFTYPPFGLSIVTPFLPFDKIVSH